MDWASRRVLSFRACQSRSTAPSVSGAVEEAIAKYGCPEIFNTDQGAQFTSAAFTGLLHAHGITISMLMAKAAGATTSLWNASGARSNTKSSLPARVYRDTVSAATAGLDALPHPLQHPPAALEPRGPNARRSVLHATLNLEKRRSPARASTYLRPKSCTEKRSHF